MDNKADDSTAAKKVSFLKKARATICHHCPMCKHARNKPLSILGKVLHHKLHSDNCPMWKAEQELYQND